MVYKINYFIFASNSDSGPVRNGSGTGSGNQLNDKEMENNFSVENSLRLITETIERSRSTIVKNAGKPLIVWDSS